jgi:hypothetical protein
MPLLPHLRLLLHTCCCEKVEAPFNAARRTFLVSMSGLGAGLFLSPGGGMGIWCWI